MVGYYQHNGCAVDGKGEISYMGINSDRVDNAVRPAIWLDIENYKNLLGNSVNTTESFKSEEEVVSEFEIKSGCLISYNGNGNEVIIPSNVLVIGTKAFYNCDSITSVTIPNGVAVIEKSAFLGCRNLKSVILPDSVTHIDDYAFSMCSSLESITIPEGVTRIGYRAFFNCKSLTSLTIPSTVRDIGNEAFGGCTNAEIIKENNNKE